MDQGIAAQHIIFCYPPKDRATCEDTSRFVDEEMLDIYLPDELRGNSTLQQRYEARASSSQQKEALEQKEHYKKKFKDGEVKGKEREAELRSMKKSLDTLQNQFVYAYLSSTGVHANPIHEDIAPEAQFEAQGNPTASGTVEPLSQQRRSLGLRPNFDFVSPCYL
ncbi:hypothetical protein CDL15_Pgr018904 [Punica granatum]|uniref:Uncharacterized protein n=1 Tax=Punica granatum TaxID=22663 RepID=A0A218WLY0_PUNGR|nr:hypothetical protein CDL15_Pgr018904 [Punica granatum]